MSWMKVLRIIIILIELGLLLFSASEIIEYSITPENYMIGSEAMVSSGGWSYQSVFNFFIFHLSIMGSSILLFVLVIFKLKRSNYLIYILIIIFQIVIVCFL